MVKLGAQNNLRDWAKVKEAHYDKNYVHSFAKHHYGYRAVFRRV